MPIIGGREEEKGRKQEKEGILPPVEFCRLNGRCGRCHGVGKKTENKPDIVLQLPG